MLTVEEQDRGLIERGKVAGLDRVHATDVAHRWRADEPEAAQHPRRVTIVAGDIRGEREVSRVNAVDGRNRPQAQLRTVTEEGLKRLEQRGASPELLRAARRAAARGT